MKQWMKAHSAANIHVPLWTNNIADHLEPFAENVTIGDTNMLAVLNWVNVLKASLELKAKYVPLQTGTQAVRIDDQTYRISIDGERISVICQETDADYKFTGKEAIRKLFGTEGLRCFRDASIASWFPAPLEVLPTDGF